MVPGSWLVLVQVASASRPFTLPKSLLRNSRASSVGLSSTFCFTYAKCAVM